MQGYPEEWIREFKDEQALITDPAGRCMALSNMAFALRRRNEIDDDQLSDMLELADAGKEWALSEIEDGHWIGLFDDHPDVSRTGLQYFDGKKMVIGE
jgi:hypothetical protein